MNTRSGHKIVYSLQKHEGSLSFFYPAAYVAEVRKGEAVYTDRIANKTTISGYGFEFEGTCHEELFQICEETSLAELARKFSGKNKKSTSSTLLLLDQEVHRLALKYIDKKIDQFLQILQENSLSLYLEVERKVFLPSIKYSFSEQPAVPKLYFEKKHEGMDYILKLESAQTQINLQEGIVEVVSDRPPWLLCNYTIYRISEINGKKLLPFIKRPTLFIPERITKTYFEKFILSVVGKVEVDVTGFNIRENNVPEEATLHLIENFATGIYEMEVKFRYGSSYFSYGNKAKQRASIAFDAAEQIIITLNKRNPELEFEKISSTLAKWMEETPAKRFVLRNEEDPFALFTWLSKNINLLREEGFAIPVQYIKDAEVNLEKYDLTFKPSLQIDWFDLKGIIHVGEEEIGFASLIEHIKNDIRIYKLESGKHFVIPMEWMVRFERIAKFAELDHKKAKLSKSNYTLLDQDIAGDGELQILDRKEIDFTVPKLLKAQLRKYQLEGVEWLATHYANGLGACLADDMGLGKTLQTIAMMLHAKEHLKESSDSTLQRQLSLFDTFTEENKPLRALILVPSSLTFNWKSELKKFAPSLTTYSHVGPKRSKHEVSLLSYDVIISTYQTALRDKELMKKIEFEYIVLDECQYIKNRNSKIFQALSELHAKHKISLSGTPIENSLADLWSQMEFINPEILGSYSFFKKHYQYPIEKARDVDAIEELKTVLEPFILRRTKREVLTELPELLEQTVFCEMSDGQKKLFEIEKSKIRNFLLSKDYKDPKVKFHVFAGLLRLRQIANHPKLIDEEKKVASGKFQVIANTITSLLKAQHKLLIFSSFKGHLRLVSEFLDQEEVKYVSLTGDDKVVARNESVQRFNDEKECKVFLISLKAGGVGLNLTAADYVLILDPWWNPFAERQAVARAHRIGQQNKVNVLRFISSDSIEEKIQKLQSAKLELAENFIDVGDVPKFDKEEIMDLLR